jgi:hypothetical protein
MPVPIAPLVVLSDVERETLERWARRHSLPRRSRFVVGSCCGARRAAATPRWQNLE